MAKSSQNYEPKDRIEHSVYGTGTIVESNVHHTVIAFDEAGTRKFVTSMVKLKGSDTEAPARPVRKKKSVAKKATAKKATAKKATTKKATTKKAAAKKTATKKK